MVIDMPRLPGVLTPGGLAQAGPIALEGGQTMRIAWT
jgi:hypothetical protein